MLRDPPDDQSLLRLRRHITEGNLDHLPERLVGNRRADARGMRSILVVQIKAAPTSQFLPTGFDKHFAAETTRILQNPPDGRVRLHRQTRLGLLDLPGADRGDAFRHVGGTSTGSADPSRYFGSGHNRRRRRAR